MSAQYVQPSDLHLIIRQHMAAHGHDGLFMASLDHSPTEQLAGADWHTTALILSAGMEHAGLANAIARVANPRTKMLAKWSRSNRHYRRRFCDSFFSALAEHRALVFAISAEEKTISAAEAHFIEQLGATHHYNRRVSGERERVALGPFINAETRETHVVELPSNQAPMALFIAHFLRRIHQQMYAGLVAPDGSGGGMLTWNFLADKPPGGAEKPFDQALTMLLGLEDWRGSLRWGYFLCSDQVETDLLADNVAGLLNEAMRYPNRYFIGNAPSNSAGLFYWERWGMPAASSLIA